MNVSSFYLIRFSLDLQKTISRWLHHCYVRNIFEQLSHMATIHKPHALLGRALLKYHRVLEAQTNAPYF